MYPNSSFRGRFTDDGLTTASGPRLVVMCYERLDSDLAGAVATLATKDAERSHELLCHAQDIVFELLCMLDLDRWEHPRKLASIYRYVIGLLTKANISKVEAPTLEARHLLAELGDAFRQASVGLNAPADFNAPSTLISVRA